MVWIGRDIRDHLVPNPLPWAGTPSTKPDCSKPHLTCTWFQFHEHRDFRRDIVVLAVVIFFEKMSVYFQVFRWNIVVNVKE